MLVRGGLAPFALAKVRVNLTKPITTNYGVFTERVKHEREEVKVVKECQQALPNILKTKERRVS